MGLKHIGHKGVNRGGSWNNEAANCRVAYRNNNNPHNRNDNLWLRLANTDNCRKIVAKAAFLFENLALTLKPTACYFGYSSLGLSFLGARIFPGRIRIKPENFHRARRRMQKRYKDLAKGKIQEEAFLHSMNSYWAYLQQFDTLGLRRKMLDEGF